MWSIVHEVPRTGRFGEKEWGVALGEEEGETVFDGDRISGWDGGGDGCTTV